MANRLFSHVPGPRLRRNLFDLSYENKLTFNMGDLIPVLCKEVVPGDKFRVNTEILLRLSPLVSPMMHRVNVYTHFFFVPNRLIYKDWEDFITGGKNGDLEPVFPRIRGVDLVSGYEEETEIFSTLANYLGIGFGLGTEAHGIFDDFSALPFRAYQMIYNEYYRDQNLEDEIEFDLGSGLVSSADAQKLREIRRRCWEKDYFTSALPWAQRGGDVRLPIAGSASLQFDNSAGDTRVYPSNAMGYNVGVKAGTNSGGTTGFVNDDNTSRYNIDVSKNHSVSFDELESTTINELRRSFRLQEWLERNARGGSRYIEQILSHFGVRSSDARLQRPEYLGGGKSPVVISEVLQTSSSDSTSPQANMAGHGISASSTHQFKKYFEEHGLIIGIMSVLPRTAYTQGVPRLFKKYDRFDYYWPEFANIGEQPVFNYELFNNVGNAQENAKVFGYQSRYSDYKFSNSEVHGEFLDNMQHWHMARQFDERPGLNKSFVASDPTSRVFAVTSPKSHKLYCQLYHNIRALRPMPRFGVPTF